MQRRHSNSKRTNTPAGSRAFSESDLATQLQAILKDIKYNADPTALNTVRKTFRSTVPLVYRSYVAAYLLRHGSFAASPAAKKSSSYKKLFVNSGRVHQLSAEQLKKLLGSIEGINTQSIGSINVFRTYSFIEVSDSIVQKVIISLTGYKLPSGKPLSVSLAKRKVDKQK